YSLMIIASAGIGVCIGLTALANRWTLNHERKAEAAKADEPPGKEGAIQVIIRDRHLLLIAFLAVRRTEATHSAEIMPTQTATPQRESLARNVCGLQPLQMGATGRDSAQKVFVERFYAHLFACVSLHPLLPQTLRVSRFFRHIRVRGSRFILPTSALTGYSLV